MKHPNIIAHYKGITVTLVNNWLTLEWGASFSVGRRACFAPGHATSDKALAHAVRILDGEFETRETQPVAAERGEG